VSSAWCDVVIDALPGFGAWVSEPGMADINVACFVNNDNGYEVSHGFHTLTTNTPLPGNTQYNGALIYYNAFVYGHGPTAHTSYAYLAGYDCK